MHLSFAKQLGLPIQPTDVEAQKIDDTMLDIHGMVVATFSVVDKANRLRFFEKIFLVADISPEIVFEMLFLTLSSTNVDFSGRELWWKTYTTAEAFPSTRRIRLVERKEFAAASLDPEYETYIFYVPSLSSTPLVAFLDIHPFRRP